MHKQPNNRIQKVSLQPVIAYRFILADQNPDSDEAGRRQDGEAGEAHHADRRLLSSVLGAGLHHYRLPLLRAVLLLVLDGPVARLYLQVTK